MPTQASGSSTSQTWIQSHSQNGCNMRGSAFSYLGVVGASAKTDWMTGDWSSGGLRTVAMGTWTENLLPSLSSSYLTRLAGGSVTLTFSASATGSVSAASSGDPYSGANAQIDYFFQFAGLTASGIRSASSFSVAPDVGEWGTVSRTITLGLNGSSFDQVYLRMVGHAVSGVGKGYNPGSIAIDQADANFGSTLVWKGVQSVRAHDANGNEVFLGSDANFSMTGMDTGFDYTNAAAVAVTATPEPSSMLLVATGILGVAFTRRRRKQAQGT